MNHIFQKNAIEFETRNYTPRFLMGCYAFPYIHRYFRLKSVNFNPCTLLRTNGDSGTRTVRYFTVLTLTDGVHIYCGNTSEGKRIASSAPALFILVMYSGLKGCASLANGDANQFHCAPIAAEGSDQRFVFGMFFVTFLNAAQVSAESNFNEKQCAFAAANVSRWWFGEIWDASGVD